MTKSAEINKNKIMLKKIKKSVAFYVYMCYIKEGGKKSHPIKAKSQEEKNMKTTTNEKKLLQERQALVRELFSMLGLGGCVKTQRSVNAFIEKHQNYTSVERLQETIKTLNLKNAYLHCGIIISFLKEREQQLIDNKVKA
jgi:hypothetical protein